MCAGVFKTPQGSQPWRVQLPLPPLIIQYYAERSSNARESDKQFRSVQCMKKRYQLRNILRCVA